MDNIIIYQNKESQKKLGEIFQIADYNICHKFTYNKNFDIEISNRDLFFMQYSLFDDIKQLKEAVIDIKKTYQANKIIIINDAKQEQDLLPLLQMGVNDFIKYPCSKTDVINLILNITTHHIYEYDANEIYNFIKTDLLLAGDSHIMFKFYSDILDGFKKAKPILIIGEFGVEKFKLANFFIKYGKFAHGVSERCNLKHNNVKADEFETFMKKLFLKSYMGSLIFEELNQSDIGVKEFIEQTLDLFAQENLAEKLNLLFIYTISDAAQQKIDVINDNIHIIKVPSLRDLKSDIPDLINSYMKQLSSEYGITNIEMADTVYQKLKSYDWSGNFFELHNLLELLFMKALNNNLAVISDDLLPNNIVNNIDIKLDTNYQIIQSDLKTARAIFEKQYLVMQLKRFGGNISNTASFIGMERTALHRKLSGMGIKRADLKK